MLDFPLRRQAGQNWVAKVLSREVFERSAVALRELSRRLGRTILRRDFAAAWGRFSLDTFFYRYKRKYLAKGEITLISAEKYAEI